MTSVLDQSDLIIINDLDESYFGNESSPHSSTIDDDKEICRSMSMSNSYSKEWYRLFSNKWYKSTLNSLGLNGELRSSRFRSLCWKIYLNVLPDDKSHWRDVSKDYRNKYDSLKEQFIVDLTITREDDNPLSQDDRSDWKRYFNDQLLRNTIKQDVDRTFPEIEFFKIEYIRELMICILFCFARLNPKISYRQGMHELLAPLIFVLFSDHQAYQHASEHETLLDLVGDVMNPTYLEHDSFEMLSRVMDNIGNWFTTDENIPSSPPIQNIEPFCRTPNLHASNAVLNKLTRIHDYVLRKEDRSLYERLQKLDIYPQIRWLRLLFGREFSIQDVLVIWDSLFVDNFDLVDYIFVSMLIYLKEAVMECDYTSVLYLLMKYPQIGDVHYFVARALQIREPNKYAKPPLYFYSYRNRSISFEPSPKRKLSNGSSISITRPLANMKIKTIEREMSSLSSSSQSMTTENNEISGFCMKCVKCSIEIEKQIDKLENLVDKSDNEIGSSIKVLKQIKDILKGKLSVNELNINSV